MAEAANSSQLKEAFTGHLEQTEGHLRLLGEIFHRILTDSGNSERVHRRSILMTMRWWPWEHGFLRE
jgi:ferritin-like metal-binding protein YciE